MSFVAAVGLIVEATRGGSPLVAPHRSPDETSPDLELPAAIDRAALARLCERVRRLVARGAGGVVCDVAEHDGLATVAVLARLQLTALRAGGRIEVRNGPEHLRELLTFTGLSGVLGPSPLRIQPRRQPEEREEPLGVQKEGDAADPVA